jgi:hypothetical protein
MPRGDRRTKRPAQGTGAFHLKEGATHVVGVRLLRVVLTNEEGGWFAQGLEIDYFAQGSSREDVKRRFEEGLCATIDEYLKKHGSIEWFLQPAPDRVWNEFLRSKQTPLWFSSLSVHRHDLGIQYYQLDAAA